MLGDNGFIESPNYPEKYGNNKLCIWRIKVAPEKTLDFTLGIGLKFSQCRVQFSHIKLVLYSTNYGPRKSILTLRTPIIARAMG